MTKLNFLIGLLQTKTAASILAWKVELLQKLISFVENVFPKASMRKQNRSSLVLTFSQCSIFGC